MRLSVRRTLRVPDPVRLARFERSPDLGPRLLVFSGGTALRPTSRELVRYTRDSIHIVTPPRPGRQLGGASPRLFDDRHRGRAQPPHGPGRPDPSGQPGGVRALRLPLRPLGPRCPAGGGGRHDRRGASAGGEDSRPDAEDHSKPPGPVPPGDAGGLRPAWRQHRKPRRQGRLPGKPAAPGSGHLHLFQAGQGSGHGAARHQRRPAPRGGARGRTRCRRPAPPHRKEAAPISSPVRRVHISESTESPAPVRPKIREKCAS